MASVLDRAALEKGGLSWKRYARSLLPALLSPLHPHLGVISTPHLVSATIAKLRALSYLQTPSLPTAVSEHLCYSSAHTQNSASVPPTSALNHAHLLVSLPLCSGHHHPPIHLGRYRGHTLSPSLSLPHRERVLSSDPCGANEPCPRFPTPVTLLRAQTQHLSPHGASGLSVYPTARDFFFQKHL